MLLLATCLVKLPDAGASPLRLDYDVTDLGGGLYDYDFTLTLDNNDGTFAAGHGWQLVVFGAGWNSPSPLTDFLFDTSDFSVGSFGFSSTTGSFNGPSLIAVDVNWYPAAVGESLYWSGTSTAFLDQGSLRFWAYGVNGGATANLETAHLGKFTEFTGSTAQVPEQIAVLPLLAAGLLGLMALRHKRAK